jgi:hypothetical protein
MPKNGQTDLPRVPAGLIYIEMKTRRAKEHLDELTKIFGDFAKNAYSVSYRDHAKRQLHFVKFEFQPLPFQAGMLVGEFAYALRSGLDQLAWQLALLNMKPKRPRTHTSFPIWSRVPTKGFGDATKDILPAALNKISLLQPYQKGPKAPRHPLYMLNELCIIDKHMILPIRANDGMIHVSGADFRSRRELPFGFELEFALTDKFKISIHPIKTEIVFGEPIGSSGSEFEIRLADFTTIYDFVRNEVIPAFRPLFD